MKKHLLFLILCLMGILTSCSQKHTRYYIGVSQCSDDEWRHKMNHEIVREALFYDGVEVEIRTAKDNNRNQIEDINYFIDRKVDLLIVAPNEAAAVTPVVEKAYGLGIGSPDKPGGLSIQLCKSEKKEFYIRYSS